MPVRRSFLLSGIFIFLFSLLPSFSQAAFEPCQGECLNYYSNAQCPNGLQWDFDADCQDGNGDLRCCNPVSQAGTSLFPMSGSSQPSGSSCPGACVRDGSACNNGEANGGEGCQSGYHCCATTSQSSPYGSGSGSGSSDSDSNPTNGSGGAWLSGIQMAGEASGLPKNDAESVLVNFMKWLLEIFIILAFISFVITGIMYLLAGPKKDMADTAKNAFQYSIIALVVTLSAFILITLINELLRSGWMF